MSRWLLACALVALVHASTYNVNFNNKLDCDSDMCDTYAMADDANNKNKVFYPLMKAEQDECEAYLFSKSELGLVKTQTSNTNFIFRLDKYWPAKTETLNYLDGSGPMPARYCIGVLHMRNTSSPNNWAGKMVALKVGPFPMDSTTTYAIMSDYMPTAGSSIAGVLDGYSWGELFSSESTKIATALSFAFMASFGIPGSEVRFRPSVPFEGSFRAAYARVYVNMGNTRAMDMHRLPVSWLIDMQEGQVIVTDYQWCDQSFATLTDLITAYNTSSTFNKCIMPDRLTHWDWARATKWPTQRKGAMNLRGPGMDMPGVQPGPFTSSRISTEGRTIRWMGWEMTVTHDQKSGPHLMNINFKGERMYYEVSFQELAIGYAGNDMTHSNIQYLDSSWGLGELQSSMRGVDCPEQSLYMDAGYYGGGFVKVPDAVCIYEEQSGLLWRRGPLKSALQKRELVVQYMLPVGNYEYALRFRFGLSGSLETWLGATGYIETQWWRPEDGPASPYGYKVAPHTTASLHDHTSLWKVDMDVVGTTNTLQVVTHKADTFLNAINSGRPSTNQMTTIPKWAWIYGKNNAQQMRHVVFANMSTESQTTFQKGSTPKKYLFLNNDPTNAKAKNAWGVPRSLWLDFIGGHSSQVLTSASFQADAAPWIINELQVSLRKDTEQYGSGMFNQWEVGGGSSGLNTHTVLYSSAQFNADNENIAQKDLVAWVSCHMLHLPGSEDYPITDMASAGFRIRPYNYFDENPSLDIPNHFDSQGLKNREKKGWCVGQKADE
eukprot:NODE_351_length_2627_cov_68.477236_g331_i0.p1 GENE.NODE_351_length_2627_cov_68.477236_g331_i0~~NODE_351_length_2627_cov_68.477236_g331_i0.p1  ORF type:complete len:775 (+),score=195.80 NODE_351_length_2627_cov_68.477236_g331_i0:56-2380(+)